jgi:hypothetical protein
MNGQGVHSNPPEVMNAVRVARDAKAMQVRWLSANLSDQPRGLDAMREPSLSCGDEPDSYRILWRHSFTSWGAAMVRMSRSKDSWVMTAVQFGDSRKRNEVLRRSRILSEEEARSVSAAVNEFELWTRKDFSRNPNVDDGDAWMVEGRRGSAYHPVFCINAVDSELRKLALPVLDAAGIRTRLTES